MSLTEKPQQAVPHDAVGPAPVPHAARPGVRRLAASAARAIRRHPGVALAALWLAAVIVAAVAPGLFTSQSALTGVPADRLHGPSLRHLFGVDQLGRDEFSRVVHGAAASLSAAFAATAVGLLAGTALGLVAGFARSWTDSVIMRVIDVLLAIPSLLLALVLMAVLGPGLGNVAVATGMASIAGCTRIMRSEVLRVRESQFVEAARANGARAHRVLLRHVLPNSLGPVLALAALELGGSILAVSSLSFLGYGQQPPNPEWGGLVSDGSEYLRGAWWLAILPGLSIAATVLAANRISHAINGRTLT